MVVEDGKCTADLILRRYAALRLTIYSASLCLVAFLAPSIAPQTEKTDDEAGRNRLPDVRDG